MRRSFATTAGRLAAVALACALGGCSDPDPEARTTAPSRAAKLQPTSAAGPTAEDYRLAVESADPAAVDRLVAKLTRWSDDEGHEYLIFEGDLPYSEEQVRAILQARRGKREKRGAAWQPELKLQVDEQGGRQFWGRTERTLTYAVDKTSFAKAPPGVYADVVSNLAAAAAEWERLCDACGVSIDHRPEYDTAPDRSKLVFLVRWGGVSPEGNVALAFFPSATPDQRTLFVYDTYPGTSFNKTGVFRHELGHILGYAHEHLDANSGCVNTGDGWAPITAYDPKSVMHYVCGWNGGDYELKFTDCDLQGHRRVYGSGTGGPPPPTQTVRCKGATV